MESGFIAYQSDRIEELVDRLVVELAREERRQVESLLGRPFAEHLVVIPTKNLQAYLEFEVAARLGVVSGVEFTTVQPFLMNLLPVDEDGECLVRVLDRPLVTRLLLSVLSDEEVLARPEMKAVGDYIYGGRKERDVIERRRFQLASKVSRLFEEYGYSRRELLERWGRGETGLKELYNRGGRIKRAHLELEAWQMALWQELYGEEGRVGRLREELGDDRDWRTLPDAIYELAADEEAQARGQGLQWPECVHLFGQSYLPRFFRDLFSTRTYAEERLIGYVMNPCLEHWSHGVAGDREEDPVFELLGEESILSGDEYPLALEMWGRAGRDFQRMLDEVTYDRWDVSEREEREDWTLLQAYQSMIRELKTAREVFEERELPSDKKSFNFWSCASVQRECESIASEIWELVTTHEGLRFNDIAVVVQPGRRTEYQTHLRAAFEQSGGIPCNIIDVQGVERSAFLEGARLLMELPLGKFRRRELLSLLVHPSVMATHPEADGDAWMRWCDALHIYQGGSKEELEGTYLERDRFTWDQGMRRLLLGSFMSHPERDQPRPFEVFGEPYLVHEVEHGEMEAASVMAMLVDELVSKGRQVATEMRPLGEWMDYLREEISRHLTSRDAKEERAQMHLLGALAEIGARDIYPDEPVGYRVAYEFAAEALAELEDSYGQYLADGVVVSAFRPMRPIPFQVVFVTGLGESEFPAPDPPDSLDLRRLSSEMHDVNARDQDLYMFLETVMSTRSRLYLSWVGRQEVTGDELEPASVVHQLRETILAMAPSRGERALEIRQELEERVRYVQQPLRRYDRLYFPEIFGGEPQVIDGRGPDGIEPGPEEERTHGEPRWERVFPNHHGEARQEARALWAKERLMERVPAGYRPSMQGLEEALAGEVFDEVARALNWARPEAERASMEGDRVVLQLRHLQKFLECPMQGAAQTVLRLYAEDDDDVVDRDHEPFEGEFLDRLGLVRGALEEVLREDIDELRRDRLEEALDERASVAELRGELPSGVYFEAERERTLQALERYAEALKEDGEGPFLLKNLRFGAPYEGERVDEVREPLSFDVSLSDGQQVTVDIHGLVKTLEGRGRSSLILAAGREAGGKYFARGAIEQLALLAAGEETAGEIRVVNSRGELEVRQLLGTSREEASAYLKGLVSELVGEVHDYFMPVEMAEELLKKPDSDVSELAEKLKEPAWGGGFKASSQYGPVRRWQDPEPPERSTAQEIMARRFEPLRGVLLKGSK